MSDKKGIKPIFVFCMPRSGSTLLQRVLMSHSQVSSYSEPHILLPLAQTLKMEGAVAQYLHQNVVRAVEDLIQGLPNKEDDYFRFIRQFVQDIYGSLSEHGAMYFLDKTPNYRWIIPELIKIFPDAKFVFLYRNPIQCLSSAIQTFGKGRFHKTEMFYLSSIEGFEEISKGSLLVPNNSFTLNYESFVKDPVPILRNLLDYLELEFEPQILKIFSQQQLDGRLGDPSGVKEYKTIDNRSLDKWRGVFNTRFRKSVLKRYISKFSEQSLKIQGYEKEVLLKEIDDLKTDGKHSLFLDLKDTIRLKLISKLKFNLFFGKNLRWTRKKYLN